MIGSSYNYNINIFIINKFTPILVKVCRFLAADLLYIGSPAIENAFVDITQCNTLYLRVFKK